MNKLIRFFNSSKLHLWLAFIINVAGLVVCEYFGYAWAYFSATLFLSFISVFFLAGRTEKDNYKLIVFLTMLILPLVAMAYGRALKEKKGNKKIRKDWSDIVYRNRKTVFQSSETMQILKNENEDAYKTCNYLVNSVGMPCFQNAKVKYYSFGDVYFNDLFEECKKAKRFIFLECYKIVPGKLWTELFDILRLKAREGVIVRLMYDDSVCTKYMPSEMYEKMQNHGIETIPFNRLKGGKQSTFLNCRNFKRICIVDGNVGFFAGYNIDDAYVTGQDRASTNKDCALKLQGDCVRNLTVMFLEDYQFATKKVVNLQEYFCESESVKTKDWVLPYSTNPVSLEHTNKGVILSLINNAKESINIVTSYIALDDELKNALVIASKSGIKVRLVFAHDGGKRKYVRALARSYFYDLIKEGIEVYEYKNGKMTTRLIMIDENAVLISTNNLDCLRTYKHFNAGVYVYGEAVILVHNDMREILAASQSVSMKDLQKRKITEKISAIWRKFTSMFK